MDGEEFYFIIEENMISFEVGVVYLWVNGEVNDFFVR